MQFHQTKFHSIRILATLDCRYPPAEFALAAMTSVSISVSLAGPEHYTRIVDYFVKGDAAFLDGMGVDPKLLPARDAWLKTLYENHQKPIDERNIFYVIWHVDGNPIGHSNINKIVYGQEAYMHLHMWQSDIRNQGLGFQLVKESIPFYFLHFKIKNLYCEPYALNPAPNKTLKKLGFEFIKEYESKPGLISFLQPVNRWCLTEARFQTISKTC
jgi:RimJ/RimL family protein N-acetyltransferase